MIIQKQKRYIHFLVFVIPALFFYSLFFIYPFFKGVQYSFTDWNGIVPEIPISFEKEDFENNIIPKIKGKDSAFLRTYYKLDNNDLYKREYLNRSVTNKIKKILKKIGITPIKFVGLQNFKEMFNSKIDQRFMPRINENYLFRENDELLYEIKISIFNKYLLKKIKDKEELKILYKAYSKSNDEFYFLNEEFNEFSLFDRLDVIEDIDFNEIDIAIDDIKDASFNNNPEEKDNIINNIDSFNLLNDENKNEVIQILEKYYSIFRVKSILAKYMHKKEFNMGVIGFTLFFTFFNVILTNLVALLIALALEKQFRSCNVLRSVFFLPNVLSLIIVAFIWSFIFYAILPKITGIQIWLSNPKLAPILVILVSVWRSCGYVMLIYLAGLQSIPKEINEVASIDGTYGLQKFFSVTLPLLFPAFTICIFWSLAHSLKAFDLIYALVGSSSYVTNTTPIVMDIYFDAFNSNRFGYATAKALFLCLIIIFVTSIQLLIMKRREIEL